MRAAGDVRLICLNVGMLRPSITNLLTVAATLAGVAIAVGATFGYGRFLGAAIGAVVALGALLVRSVARDLGRAIPAQQRLRQDLEAVAKDVRAMRSANQRLQEAISAQGRRVDEMRTANRRLHDAVLAQGRRVDEQVASMTRRILVDLHATRLEHLDAREASDSS